ncbi:hypothetical protein [Rhodococcus chondri]|uniref:Uncharacterized protein n=1 Tax=Rhodococcus chondri TaxID=3065941 RepID=A0ABU7JQF2_9NOCA|nr:hypothetical protein [Rhodococcus sp. CC-R104]MEE2032253.1 hypothetical protein [Rhodococcus sp. CC-R104]
MEFVASVPILFALIALLHFISRRIVDSQIRSVEKELGSRVDESPTHPELPAVGDEFRDEKPAPM